MFDALFKLDHLKVFKGFAYVGGFAYPEFNIQCFKSGYEHRIYFDDGNSAVRRLNTFLPEMSFLAVRFQFSFWCYNCIVRCEHQFKFCWRLWELMFNAFAKKVVHKQMEIVFIGNG